MVLLIVFYHSIRFFFTFLFSNINSFVFQELSKIYENEREFPVTDDPLSTAIDGTCALDEDEEESGEEDDNGDDIGSLMDSGTEEALDEDFSEEESVEVQSGDSEENGLPGSCSAVGEDGTCKGLILQEPNDLTSTEHDHSLENQDSLASSEAITEVSLVFLRKSRSIQMLSADFLRPSAVFLSSKYF